ncbi:MAG: hypothetical protein QG574_3415 [Cyanobacteriota bacterium erpe_2018_sw_21hr_WHONDRS-SW48-000092_B_bin.40]|jgi:hypothetical protein|nr:hypothetical protein [Cyanobacteriota bacterium erpe_2018_sw_21hr_WHONDRS-SW48-000092_B_bin.40]
MNKHLSLLLTARSKQVKVEADWAAWLKQALSLSVLVALVKLIFPHAIPYSFWELWNTTGSVGDWLTASWPILLWAVGITFLMAALTRNSRYDNYYAERHLAAGIWLSLRAGIMEEIVFRWLIFMWCIAMAKLSDFILGGFLFEHGLVWLLYSVILSPIADFFTFGLLHGQLSGTDTWFIAAALLMANSQFRNGHKYQGLLGFVNSWFIGMYMFYLLFTFGLMAAIVVHLVYDLCIFAIEYFDRAHERSRY